MSGPAVPPGADDLHVVRQDGDGRDPAVVIVHGGMDRSSSFGRVARQLPEVPLVRYDRRGYGRSVALGAAPFDRHVADLLAVVGAGPVAVFGHSVGGVIALAAAAQAPDRITALLLHEPPTPWAPWWPSARQPDPEDAADQAEAFMRRMVGDRIWERLPARTRADRRAEGDALRADLAGIDRTTPPYDAAAVVQRTLVTAGTATSERHRRAAQELAASLPAGTYEDVAGADHGAHLTAPAAMAELVRRVRAVAGSGRPMAP